MYQVFVPGTCNPAGSREGGYTYKRGAGRHIYGVGGLAYTRVGGGREASILAHETLFSGDQIGKRH